MIKQLLSTLALVAAVQFSANAQCTPAAQYADSTFGVWPDTTENIPCAYADEVNGYNTVINLKTLTDTVVAVNVAGNNIVLTAYIEAFRVNGVTGLPTGFAYIPNQSTWTNGGSAPNYSAVQGCLSLVASQSALQDIIASNPQGADFPLTVVVDAKINSTDNTVANLLFSNKWLSEVNTAGIEAIDVVGYVIKVRPTGTGASCEPLATVEVSATTTFDIQGNYPNPFAGSTEIRFSSPTRKEVSFEVRNMVGKQIIEKRIVANRGTNSMTLKSEQLTPGIYFYSISDGKQTITRKMVVSAN